MVKYRRLTRKSYRPRSRRFKSTRNRRHQRRRTKRRLVGGVGPFRKTMRRIITGDESIPVRQKLFGCAQPQGNSSPTEQEYCANRVVQNRE